MDGLLPERPIRDLVSQYPAISPEQNRHDLIKHMFSQVYDTCYVAALNRPLEELQDLYQQRGIKITMDTLRQIRIQFNEDITRLRVVFQLIVDYLLTCGLSHDKAYEFISDYHAGKYAC